jgi:hypothetical protein
LPLDNWYRIAAAQRPQNRCDRRLATPIFSVDKSQFFERDLAAGRDGIELSDIPDELNTIDHCASAEDA